MRIAVLSRNPRGYSAKRFREAASARGHEARILDTLRFAIGLERGRPELIYRGKRMRKYDAVLPRIGASITFFGLAVLRQFEQMGVYTINESVAIQRSRDKLRSMQILSRYDVGLPATAFVRGREDVLPAIERVGGVPVILKVLEGTQGVGVILAESARTALAIVETLQSAKQQVLIQKFVSESKGRDIRAFVVGDRVVAAMRRTAQGDEFRSNVHRGGKAASLTLDPAFAETAVRAAQIMGLRLAGVDMLEGERGPQVMEVNSSPGLEGIENATGVDVAGAIIEEFERQVLFPEVNLTQRLRLASGFGIAELSVTEESLLAGRKLRDSNLSARGINVLHISRCDRVLPNPGGDADIELGDVLLCYGNLDELRSLVPPGKKGRRRAKQEPVPMALEAGA